MKLVMDKAGRVVVPKSIRDALGLAAGGVVDASIYGEGLQLIPVGRTARLVSSDSGLVAESVTAVDDETVFTLADSIRR